MRIQKIFADNLRSYRKRAGLTQEQLAEKSGLHRTYIGGIEQERINVSLKNINKIADALDIDPALLMLQPGTDAEGKPQQTVLGNNEHALLSRRGGGTSVSYIDVEDPSLSIQIITSLILQGFEGDQLASVYDKTHREVLKVVKGGNKAS